MSNDYVNSAEDTDMAECDGEKVVTMMDVLQEQEEFEEDANAVLGASDDKNCTYSKVNKFTSRCPRSTVHAAKYGWPYDDSKYFFSHCLSRHNCLYYWISYK